MGFCAVQNTLQKSASVAKDALQSQVAMLSRDLEVRSVRCQDCAGMWLVIVAACRGQSMKHDI